MAFLRKEKCFRLAAINGGSDGTCKVAAAITQLAGGSKSTSVLTMQSYRVSLKIQPENRTVSMDKCHLSSAPMPELQWLSW